MVRPPVDGGRGRQTRQFDRTTNRGNAKTHPSIDFMQPEESAMLNCTLGLPRRRLAATSLIAMVYAIGFSSLGQAAESLGPLVRVTGADPFATCTADNVHSQETAYGSKFYPNTVIEPWIAV